MGRAFSLPLIFPSPSGKGRDVEKCPTTDPPFCSPMTIPRSPIVLRRSWSASGFHVLVVSDGMSALEKAQAHHPELIILDVLMPRMDGREVLRRLRRSRIHGLQRSCFTQVGEASECALALEEGADDYLNKPFDPHELLARICAVLRRARPGERSLSAAWLLTANDLSLDRRARRANSGR